MNKEEKNEMVRRSMSFMWLLFEEQVENPSAAVILARLREKYPKAEIVSGENLRSFALPEHTVDFKDAKGIPYQVIMGEVEAVKKPHGDGIARTQFWQTPNGAELLDTCKWQVMIGDFISASHPAKVRANILSDWLEIALGLFPGCKAVFFASSQNVMTAEALKKNPYQDVDRIFHGAVNVRFFNIQGTNDMLVDTLGLHILGVSDIQFHFHGINPNAIVTQAYNIAMYQLDYDMPIHDGELVDGIDENGQVQPDVRWKCQYEISLLEPKREVLDVEAGEFASGKRKK